MWSPTHVQVTVCRAKGLLTKGKHGTNDAFVVIALGKEKFQTSVKQKAPSEVDWQEECELSIPNQGNTAEIILTVLHQNFIGVDEFLGTVSLPLANLDVYERPKNRWYTLHSKPGQESKTKYRGELEIRVAFTVKSGSLLDLSKKEKHKGSLGQISQAASNFTGSLMSLGSKEKKNIKKLASSVGHKLSKLPGRGSLRKEKREGGSSRRGSESIGEPDPGVISEDEDEFRFDELSHKSSGSSLNVSGSRNTSISGSLENLAGGEFMRRNSMPRNSSSTLPRTPTISPLAIENPPKPARSLSKEEPVDEWDKKLFGKQGKLAESAGPVQSGVPSIIVQGSNPFDAGDAVLPKITEESLGQFERRKPVTVSLTRRRDLGKDEVLPDVFEEVEPVKIKEEPKTKIKGKEAAVVMPVPRDASPAPRHSKSSSQASDNTPTGVKEPSHVSGEIMHPHLHARASFPSPSHPSSEASSFPVLPLEHDEPSETPEEPSIDRFSESRITARSPVPSSASSPAANRRSTEESSTAVPNVPVQASVPTEALETKSPLPAPREKKNDAPMEIKPVPLPRSTPTAKASEPAQTTTQIQLKWDEMQESRVDDEEESEVSSGYVNLWSYQPQISPTVGGVTTASMDSSSLEIRDVRVKVEDEPTKLSDLADSESYHTPFSFAFDTETKPDVDANAEVVELPWVEPDLQHGAVYEDDLASDILENREEEEKMAPIDRSSYYKIISESTINQSLLTSGNISGNFSIVAEEYSPIKKSDSPKTNVSKQAVELEDEDLVVSASVQGNVLNSSVIAGQVNRTDLDDQDLTKSLLLSNSEIDHFSKPNQPVINSSPKSHDNERTNQTEYVNGGSQPVSLVKTKRQSSFEDMGSISNHLAPRSQSTEPLPEEEDRRSTQTSSGVLSGSLEPSTSNYESDHFQGNQGRKVVKADPNLLHLDSEISESDDYDDNLHKDRSPGSKEHRAALASFPQRVVEGKEMAEEEVPLKVTKKELSQYEGKSRDELVALICNLKSSAAQKDQQIVELKEYIGELLLRVMENAPGILQNPPSPVN